MSESYGWFDLKDRIESCPLGELTIIGAEVTHQNPTKWTLSDQQATRLHELVQKTLSFPKRRDPATLFRGKRIGLRKEKRRPSAWRCARFSFALVPGPWHQELTFAAMLVQPTVSIGFKKNACTCVLALDHIADLARVSLTTVRRALATARARWLSVQIRRLRGMKDDTNVIRPVDEDWKKRLGLKPRDPPPQRSIGAWQLEYQSTISAGAACDSGNGDRSEPCLATIAMLESGVVVAVFSCEGEPRAWLAGGAQ